MTSRRSRAGLGLWAVVVLLLGAVGCSGGGGENRVPPAAPTSAAPPPPPALASPLVRPAGSAVASPGAAVGPTAPARPAGPPVAPTPGSTPTVFRSDAAEVGPIVWAAEIDPETKAPRAPVGSFPVDAPTIYAALPVAHVKQGTKLTATWSYNGTPLDGFVSIVTAERDERDVWIEFHIALTGDERWPTGTYAVTVTVNGELAQAAAVLVEAPAG